jgi:AAA domain
VLDSDKDKIEPPSELIHRLLPRTGSALLAGQSSAGKTAVMVYLNTCLAAGISPFGKRVSGPIGVISVLGEGFASQQARYFAQKKHLQLTRALPIAWTRCPGSLSEIQTLEGLIGDLVDVGAHFKAKFGVELGMVSVDTVAACFALRDENSNAEAAQVCSRLQKISDETGALAIGVHHHGKDQYSGPRGASAFRAGVDALISVPRDQNQETGQIHNRRSILSKARDGVEGPISAFDLRFIQMGIDAFGEAFGAVVVEPTGQAISAKGSAKKPLSQSRRTFNESFDAALAVRGQQHCVGGDGVLVTAVDLQHVRAEFSKRYVTGKSSEENRYDAVWKAFKRCIEGNAGIYGREVKGDVEWIWRLS